MNLRTILLVGCWVFINVLLIGFGALLITGLVLDNSVMIVSGSVMTVFFFIGWVVCVGCVCIVCIEKCFRSKVSPVV